MKANETSGYVDISYLSNSIKAFSKIKERSYKYLIESNPTTLLDVGCGHGQDVFNMAAALPGTKVCGIDYDPEMIESAQAREISYTYFSQGSAYDIPYDDDSVSGCRNERLLMHLEQPIKALSEMHRVVRPGCKVVSIDSDWNSLSINTSCRPTLNKVLDFLKSHVMASGYTGIELPSYYSKLHFNNMQVNIDNLHTSNYEEFCSVSRLDSVIESAIEARVISTIEASKLITDLDSSSFFASMNIVTVCGEK